MSAQRTYHAPRLTLPVGRRDHIRGDREANVTLVEYGDYQCPFCGAAHPIVKELLDVEPVLFVYRHFPLTTVHPYAEIMAETAEAAGAQGAYWPMHDWLFAHQKSFTPDEIPAAAAALGLDANELMGDVTAHRYEPKIREDFMSGVRSGVNGTPTFFINGERHDGDWDFDSLLEAIRASSAV